MTRPARVRLPSVASWLLLAHLLPGEAFVVHPMPSCRLNSRLHGKCSSHSSRLFGTAAPPAEVEVEVEAEQLMPPAVAILKQQEHHAPPQDEEMDALLHSLDPAILGSKFIERIRELAQYSAENGHCNVPKRYGPLGNFVNKQRQLHRKHIMEGQRNSLTPQRIRVLEQMGFEWTANAKDATRRRNERIWMDHYGELRDHRRVHGTCRIPSDHPNARLVAWVAVQRREYRRILQERVGGRGGGTDGGGTSSTFLTAERMELLDAIGFETSSAHDELFDTRLAELREYKSKFGDTLVPITYENRGLAQWVSRQRLKYHQLHRTGVRPYGFSEERIAALDDLGFVWSYRRHKDDASLDDLADEWLRENK